MPSNARGVRRVAVAVCVLAACLGAAATGHGASQAKLQVSMTDQSQDDPVVILAGKPVTLDADAFITLTDEPCVRGDIVPGAVFHAHLGLPADVTLRDGAPASQDVTLTEEQKIVRFHWPAIASRAGVYNGQLDVTVQTKDGTTCAGTHRFQIAAVTAGPQFAVSPGFVLGKDIVVPLLAELPPLPDKAKLPELAVAGATRDLPPISPFGLPRALDDALNVFARKRLHSGSATSIDGNPALTCVSYRKPRGFSHGLLRFKFRWTWGKARGFGPVVHSGHVRIRRRPATAIERLCRRLSVF